MKRSGKKGDQVNALHTSARQEAASITGTAPASAQARYTLAATDGEGEVIAELTGDPIKWAGTPSHHVAGMLIEQSAATIPNSKTKGLSESLKQVCQSLEGLNPQTTVEGMLCAQMFGVHNLAMESMRRSLLPEQTIESATAETNRMMRLVRVFVEQADALQRLRGKAGQQRVTVEHVHVHRGGQAIVGAVTAKGPGVGDETQN